MCSSFAPTCHTWSSYYSSCSITNPTNLLYHKWSLLNSLESLTPASPTRWGRSTWFGTRSFACIANISSTKWYCFWYAIHSFHKIDFHIHHYVLTFCLNLLSSLSPSITPKHLLKFLEYVSKTTLCSTSSVKLAWETFKSLKASLAKWITSPRKWVFSTEWVLGLLISSHTSLVINSPLVIIT